MKKRQLKIVFLSESDFAGSGYFASQGINSTNRAKCRQISFIPHPWKFPTDVNIMDGPRRNKKIIPHRLEQAKEIIQEADFVHIWNSRPFDPIFNCLEIPRAKLKSISYSGSLFRENRQEITTLLKTWELSLVVQNPSYRHPEEIDSVFIPHALPPEVFGAVGWSRRIPRSFACHNKKNGRLMPSKTTTAYQDIPLLVKILAEDWPEWLVHLRTNPIPWRERINLLRYCQIYFEYLDENMQYWGRSALEACALGLPVISYFSEYAIEMSEGRLGKIPIIHATKNNLREVVGELLKEPGLLQKLGEDSRSWVRSIYNYIRVGDDFINFFERL